MSHHVTFLSPLSTSTTTTTRPQRQQPTLATNASRWVVFTWQRTTRPHPRFKHESVMGKSDENGPKRRQARRLGPFLSPLSGISSPTRVWSEGGVVWHVSIFLPEVAMSSSFICINYLYNHKKKNKLNILKKRTLGLVCVSSPVRRIM